MQGPIWGSWNMPGGVGRPPTGHLSPTATGLLSTRPHDRWVAVQVTGGPRAAQCPPPRLPKGGCDGNTEA